MEKMIVHHVGKNAKKKASHTRGKHVKQSNLYGGNGAMSEIKMYISVDFLFFSIALSYNELL